jgi:hypothetical protein
MKVGDVYRTKKHRDCKYGNFIENTIVMVIGFTDKTVEYSYMERDHKTSCATIVFTTDAEKLPTLLRELF